MTATSGERFLRGAHDPYEAVEEVEAVEEPPIERPTSAAVCREHLPYVWRTLLRLGVSRTDADDLVQDVFVVVHRRIETYDPTRPIKPWLFGIVYNVVRGARRVGWRERDEYSEEAKSDPAYRAVEAADLVHAALSTLPTERRAVFILYELDDLPVDVIARTLDIPANTVYSRLRTARKEFRAGVELLERGES